MPTDVVPARWHAANQWAPRRSSFPVRRSWFLFAVPFLVQGSLFAVHRSVVVLPTPGPLERRTTNDEARTQNGTGTRTRNRELGTGN